MTPIAVQAGQVYLVPRPGRPPRRVRVKRVNKPSTARAGAQVITVRWTCSLVELTRSGRVRREPGALGKVPIVHHLQWSPSAGQWVMGPGFELDRDPPSMPPTAVATPSASSTTPASAVCTRKTCAAAGAPQPASNFYRDRSRPSGLDCWCKACARSTRK